MGTNKKHILFVVVSFIAFFIGFKIGYVKRDVTSHCIHSLHQRTSRIDPTLMEPCGGHCNRASSVDDNSNTFLHNNYFEDLKFSALTTVFGMIHHASCPSTGELVLTTSDTWANDYSHCKEVYAVRAAVRKDHPNKCIGVMRAPNGYFSTTNINHRSGAIEYPAKIANAYQVNSQDASAFTYSNPLKYSRLFA